MRVLHIIDSLRTGGAQTLLVTYAQQAKKAGMETTIISLREQAETPPITALNTLNAHITQLPKAKLFNLSRLKRLMSLIRSGKYDLIHSHLNHANILGILCARWLHLPVVVSIHNVLKGRHIDHISEKIELFLLRYATGIIAVGKNVAEDYQPRFPKNVVTLPNAVNEIEPMTEQERAAFRHELLGDATAPLLIAVGRLTEQKGFHDLIESFSHVHSNFPHAHLIVAGEGHLRQELQNKTNSYGLHNHLHWLGMRNDVPRLLAASDLYISSAHWEGLSIALLEAMSVGAVPVVTNVGDAAEVIGAEAGRLVPPHAPEQLAVAIEALLSAPTEIRRLSNAARERIQTHYGAAAWFAKLTNIYQTAQNNMRERNR